MKENSAYKPIVYILIVAYLILTYLVLAMGDEVLNLTVREDRFFETVGMLALLASAILFFYGFFLWRKLRSRMEVSVIKLLAYLGLGFLFVFGAGEEASWGQRYIGIDTPQELMDTNVQGELNLHNLAIFEESEFLKADTIFDMFWFGFTVVVPFACLLWEPANRLANRFLPVVHWSVGLLFLFSYLWAKAAKLIFESYYSFEMISFIQAVQEIKESNYAVLFVVAALYLVRNARKLETREN